MRLGAGCIEAVVGGCQARPAAPGVVRASTTLLQLLVRPLLTGTTLTCARNQKPYALLLITYYGLTVDGVIASG